MQYSTDFRVERRGSLMALSATSSPRILLVEDDQELLVVLQDVLSEEGYEVTTAATLEAALAEVNTRVFDLIFSDVVGWKQEEPLQGVGSRAVADAPSFSVFFPHRRIAKVKPVLYNA
jgi:hypothetical protein